jgi:hypothetical protein
MHNALVIIGFIALCVLGYKLQLWAEKRKARK